MLLSQASREIHARKADCREETRSQDKGLRFHLKKLEYKQIKLKGNKRKIIENLVKINDLENKDTIKKINKIKAIIKLINT